MQNITQKIGLRGTVRATIIHEDGTVEIHENHNKIVDVGIAMMLSSGIVFSKCALGTGTNPASGSDTGLQTEVYRNSVTNVVVTGSSVSMTCFFDKNETSGTFTEFGTFINNGLTMWAHLTGISWVKPLGSSLTIDVQYDFLSV